MTSVMSARSPLSIRRCRESVFPLAAGDNGPGKEESHMRGEGNPPARHGRARAQDQRTRLGHSLRGCQATGWTSTGTG